MLLVVIAAAGMRFWQLGALPPGLYRDEATNGLDALNVIAGERSGQSPLYFEANNGREPVYIYLTSLAIRLLGRNALGVRFAAAVVGTFTTWVTYRLGRAWFDKKTALILAWLWAVTLWPVHLSRIGVRPITLPIMLALTFWLGTVAFRRQQERSKAVTGNSWSGRWLWLASGMAYGLSFYTYLAARFSPILLVVIVLYLLLTGRRQALWPGAFLFAVGTIAIITPLGWLAWQQPELVLGRLDQVSILNPATRDVSLFTALVGNTMKALGLFLVKGDGIIRHNIPGRPLFDLFMALPFLIGLGWSLRRWRRPVAAIPILWAMVMLGPTILAEDTPHYLRAVGILPAALIFPAIGLSQLWNWASVPPILARSLVLFLMASSLVLTINGYFGRYADNPQTAYWYEAAASNLAETINNDSLESDVFVDRRYLDGWPSVSFLVQPDRVPVYYRTVDLQTEQLTAPLSIYAWPHDDLAGVAAGAIAPPALVSGQTGPLAQGDLEPEPYPLYIHYTAALRSTELPLANFGKTIQLHDADIQNIDPGTLQIDLLWSASAPIEEPLATFVHIVGPVGIIAQSDAIPSQGNWPVAWWRPGLVIRDRHQIDLDFEFDRNQYDIVVGLYHTGTQDRVPLVDSIGTVLSDFYALSP